MELRSAHRTLRLANRDDLRAVVELWGLSGSVPTVTDTVESLAGLLELDPRALLVANQRGEIVGSLIAGWNGWRGSLYRLAVHPDYRRQGLGTALVREAEHRLLERGAIRLDAIVDSDEPQAVEFWAAAGYQRQRNRSRFVKNL
jgi:ribosomal protein S18 acetylase RimI-like enzyme